MEALRGPASGYGRWIWAAVATIVATAAWAGIWWLTVDRGYEVCAAIMPAPPGCATEARTPVAVTWTAIIVALYAGVLAIVFSRLRRYPSLVVFALVALAVGSLWGYRTVLY